LVQPEDCKSPGSESVALAARPRRRGDRMTQHVCCVHESAYGT
jgi:hypothetical protein